MRQLAPIVLYLIQELEYCTLYVYTAVYIHTYIHTDMRALNTCFVAYVS